MISTQQLRRCIKSSDNKVVFVFAFAGVKMPKQLLRRSPEKAKGNKNPKKKN